jgi:hypothetical protein
MTNQYENVKKKHYAFSEINHIAVSSSYSSPWLITFIQELHEYRLHSLCRICVSRSQPSTGKNKRSFKCSNHSDLIFLCYGIVVTEDNELKHSRTMCKKCYQSMHRKGILTDKTNNTSLPLDHVWTEFDPNLSVAGCSVCWHYQKQSKAGRPTDNRSKKRKNVSNASASDENALVESALDVSASVLSASELSTSNVKSSPVKSILFRYPLGASEIKQNTHI